jgi:hypothetical protein
MPPARLLSTLIFFKLAILVFRILPVVAVIVPIIGRIGDVVVCPQPWWTILYIVIALKKEESTPLIKISKVADVGLVVGCLHGCIV